MHTANRSRMKTKNLFLVLLAFAPLAGFAADADDPFDPVVARGKGVIVKRSQVDNAFIFERAKMAALGANLSEPDRALKEAQLLDDLAITQILAQHATDAERAKGKENAEKIIADSQKATSSPDAFARQLRSLGVTKAHFDQRVHDKSLAALIIEREVKSKIKITDEQVRNFYDKNPDQFKRPETALATHIMLATRDPQSGAELSADQKKARRAEIEKLLTRARNGEDFGKLARDNSEDPSSKDKNGEFTIQRPSRYPEIEVAVFAMNTNQISDIVTTPFGYHIIKVLDKQVAQKADFEKVASDIRDALLQQEMQKQLPDYFEKLKQEAGVEILDAKYKVKPPANGSLLSSPPETNKPAAVPLK